MAVLSEVEHSWLFLSWKKNKLLKGQLHFFSIFFWASQYLCVCWQQKTLNVSFGNPWQNSLFSLQVTEPRSSMGSWSPWLAVTEVLWAIILQKVKEAPLPFPTHGSGQGAQMAALLQLGVTPEGAAVGRGTQNQDCTKGRTGRKMTVTYTFSWWNRGSCCEWRKNELSLQPLQASDQSVAAAFQPCSATNQLSEDSYHGVESNLPQWI